MNKMKFETPNLTAENVAKIAELFPGVVTEGKVNFDLLRSMLGDEVFGDEAYEFTWVGKRAAIAEAGRPIRKTLRPCPEESRNWDTTENLYIEGDNLDVLKLLQESYLGKVKMIYIDPPYNTGNDFIYRDDFVQNRKEYDREAGLYDEDGDRLFRNTETNGRFHSDWCSMMYPRLVLARNLLCEDGVIFISISDREVENLKKICNEIFGSINFIGQIIWESTTQPDNIGNARFKFQQKVEYILFFAKSKAILPPFLLEKLPTKRTYPHRGRFGACRFEIIERSFEGAYARPTMRFNILDQPPRAGKQWQIGEEQARKLEAEGKVEVVNGVVKRAVYPEDEIDTFSYKPFWSFFPAQDVGTSQRGKAVLNEIMGQPIGFETVKPVELIQKLLAFFPNNGIVLDFFSGSATTAHSVFMQNAVDAGQRTFIMVQMNDSVDEKSTLWKAGYKNICEIGKERIRRAGDKIKAEAGLTAQNLDIGFRVLKLDDTNMNEVYYAAGDYTQDLLLEMEDNIKPGRTDMDLLFGCLLDWGLPLSMPHTSEKIDGFTVHTYNGGDLIACFEERISEKAVREIANRKPLRAVFRDSSFTSSPEKINVFEIFKLLAPNTTVRVI